MSEVGDEVPGLLHGPVPHRVGCDAGDVQAPGAVFEEHQAVQVCVDVEESGQLALNPPVSPSRVPSGEPEYGCLDAAGCVGVRSIVLRYTSVKFIESLALQGLSAPIGSMGDANHNALAESIIGLFRTEVVNRHGPFKTLTEVEFALMEWADWYNNARLDYLSAGNCIHAG